MVKESVICRIFLALWVTGWRWYEASGLHKLADIIASGWKKMWHGSALVDVTTREGVLSKSWSTSWACSILSFVINLPMALVHWIYRKWQQVFDSSYACTIAFAMGDHVPVAVGWLALALFIIPYEHWNNAYSLMGFTLVTLLAIAGGMRRRSLRFDVVHLGPYMVLFTAAVVLAWPLSYSSTLSMRYLFFHVTCMLCMVTVVSTIQRVEQLLRVVYFAVLTLLATGIHGVAQGIAGVEVNASYVDLSLNADMPGRVYAGFENPNSFAQVLVMLIPLGVALVLGSPNWKGRVLGVLGSGVGMVAIGMTYSRASWIGLLVAALIFIFLWNRKLLPAVIVLGLAAIPLLPDSIFNRILTIFNMEDTSTSSRFPLYEAAVRLIAQRPIVGAGLGADVVREAVKDFEVYKGTSPFVHAHNIYLQTWLEMGLLGLVSFVAAMGWTIKRGFAAVANPAKNSALRLITMGGVSAMAGILVCGLADYIWTYPRVMVVFWFVTAIAVAGIRLLGHEE